MSVEAPPLTTDEKMTVICEQQTVICKLLNEIVTSLNQGEEMSLIDELSVLFTPLFKDVAMIKDHLNIEQQQEATQDTL